MANKCLILAIWQCMALITQQSYVMDNSSMLTPDQFESPFEPKTSDLNYYQRGSVVHDSTRNVMKKNASVFPCSFLINDSCEATSGAFNFGFKTQMGDSHSGRKELWTEQRISAYWSTPVDTLKICTPSKRGFREFVQVNKDPYTNKYVVTGGFSVAVFRAAIQLLPSKVEPIFHPFLDDSGGLAGTYDDLLKQLPAKSCDVVVGDTTILAGRGSFVEFTQPYLLNSKVYKIVPFKHERRKSMLIFVLPFSWGLWLMMGIACIFVGLVIQFLEHRASIQEDNASVRQQLFAFLRFPVITLVFRERGIASKWSYIVLFIWSGMAFIMLQMYTETFYSMLTTDEPEPVLPNQHSYVGYQNGSFVKDLLVNQFNYKESQLKPYSSIREYYKALSKGSRNGGVDVIIDELPYISIFLRKYDSKFMMVGPIYDTGGFGFALPKGSPLVSDLSGAILNLTESLKLREITEKYFGPGYSCADPSASGSPGSPSLTTHPFSGLFVVAGIATLGAVLGSEYTLWQRSKQRLPSNRSESSLHSTAEMIDITGDIQVLDDEVHSPSTYNPMMNGDVSLTEAVEGEEHN